VGSKQAKFLILWVIALAGMSFWLWSVVTAMAIRIAVGYTDSAGFMELVGKSGLTSPLQSYYFTSSIRLASLYGEAPTDICPLIPTEFSGPRSVVSGHPYLISIFGSIISWLTNLEPNYVAALTITSSFVLGVSAITLFLFRNNVSVFVIFPFLITIGLYPVLTQSLLGQAYFDRLLFGPAVASFLLVWWTKYRSLAHWKLVCFFLVILILVSERGAAIAGLISVVYLLLLHGRKVLFVRELRFIFCTGVVGLIWIQIWSKVWEDYAAYAQISFGSSFSRLHFLFSEPSASGLNIFFTVSSAFLLLGIFSGRGSIPLVCSLLPNLLFGTGGAELTGFTSHYHQVYLPIVLATATIGIVSVVSFLKSQTTLLKFRFLTPSLSLLILIFSLFFSFTSAQSAYRTGVVKDSVVLLFPSQTNLDNIAKDTHIAQSQISSAVKNIEANSVSAPEGMYPSLLLAGVKVVEYWPFGVGSSDVVLAPHVGDIPNVLPFADPQGSRPFLERCVQNILDSSYNLIKVFPGDLRLYVKADLPQ